MVPAALGRQPCSVGTSLNKSLKLKRRSMGAYDAFTHSHNTVSKFLRNATIHLDRQSVTIKLFMADQKNA